MNLKILLFASMSLALFVPYHSSDDPYITLTTKILNVETEGGFFTVDLSSNVYYKVNNGCQTDGSDSHWAVVDPHETRGEIIRFTVEVSENSPTNSRVGATRFIGDDATPPKLVITQKMIVPKGISPITEPIDATIIKFSFKVSGDKEWRAVCADADVAASPANGMGECDIKSTFPENKASTKRTIKATVTIQDDIDYTCTPVQDAFSDILADQDLSSLTANTSATFADEAQSVFPGTNDKCLAPSIGSGRIEYWACDRTGYVAQNAVCSRAVGGNGDSYALGAISGDYRYVYGDMKGTTIPAGIKIRFYFMTELGTICSSYQMIEFKDGEEWRPVPPISTLQESTTETPSGAPTNYSVTITYSFAGILLDSSDNGACVPVEEVLTTTKDMDGIVLRFGQAGHLCLSGVRYAGKYIDWTHTSGRTCFSAQHPSNPETGAAVKEYNQHVLLEIIEQRV